MYVSIYIEKKHMFALACFSICNGSVMLIFILQITSDCVYTFTCLVNTHLMLRYKNVLK